MMTRQRLLKFEKASKKERKKEGKKARRQASKKKAPQRSLNSVLFGLVPHNRKLKEKRKE